MTKLEVGKAYWVKVYKTGSFEIDSFGNRKEAFQSNTGDTFEVYLNSEYVKSECATAIPEREKETVPKEVADFINGQKNLEHGVLDALEEAYLLTKLDVINWLKPVENQEKFLKAWIYGYEIEKEKLYYVKIPNVFHGDLGYSKSFDNYSFYNKHHAFGVRFELTEKEIKQNHEWAWQFAVPVEEE